MSLTTRNKDNKCENFHFRHMYDYDVYLLSQRVFSRF